MTTSQRRVVTTPPDAAAPGRVSALPRYQAALEGLPPERKLEAAEQMLHSDDPAERGTGLYAVLGQDRARAETLARELVEAGDPDLAMAGMRILLDGPGTEGVDLSALESQVHDSGLPDGQRAGLNAAVMSSLIHSKSPELPAYMGDALASDASVVRGSAVAHVAMLPTEQAVPLLVMALGDPEPQVAAGALNALVGFHGGDRKLGTDKGSWMRWYDERIAAEHAAGSPGDGAAVVRNGPSAPSPSDPMIPDNVENP